MKSLHRRRPGEFFPLTMTNVPRGTVPLYYQAASAHLLTSDVEGSPNSIKESLASGTPVVARDVGGVTGLLDGVPGCGLFAGDDPEVVADLIEKAITASAQQVRLAFLSKGLDMPRVAQRLAGIYVELVAGKKGPTSS
jgi:glycosyltransferase involved in cell wall biosynthesis